MSRITGVRGPRWGGGVLGQRMLGGVIRTVCGLRGGYWCGGGVFQQFQNGGQQLALLRVEVVGRGKEQVV